MTAILAVKIIGDGRAARRELDKTGGTAKKFGDTIERMQAPALIAGAGLLALGKKAADFASDAEQAAGAVDAVFKDQAKSIHDFASTAADRFGVAAAETEQMSALIGSQLKAAGTPMDELTGKTTGLIETAADLAAQFGGTTSDAVGALSALLRGERDPIEKYGVSIKQADVEAKKAEMGLKGLTGEAAKQADMQATLALLADQTADAHGAAAREYDMAASAQQRATAEYQDAMAVIGTALLPVMADLMTTLADVARVAGENPEAIRAVAVAFGALIAVVLAAGAAMKVYAAGTAAVAGAKAVAGGIGSTVSMLGRVRDGWVSAAAAQSGWAGRAGMVGARLRAIVTAMQAGIVAAARWTAAMIRAGAAAVAQAARSAAAWVASTARTIAALTAQAAAWIAQRAALLAGAVATGVATAAQWALNVAMSANPIGLLIAAIVAVIAIIVLLWMKCDWFRNAVMWVWEQISAGAAAAWDWIKTTALAAVDWLVQKWETFKAANVAAWRMISTWAANMLARVRAVSMAAVHWIMQKWETFKRANLMVWRMVVSAVLTTVGRIRQTITNLVGRIRTIIAQVHAIFANGFAKAQQAVFDAIERIKSFIRGLIDTAVDVGRRIGDALSIEPPGWMRDAGAWVGGHLGFSEPGSAAVVSPAVLTAASTSRVPNAWAYPASGGGGRSPMVVIEAGAIQVSGALDGDATGRALVDALDGYFRRRGQRWR